MTPVSMIYHIDAWLTDNYLLILFTSSSMAKNTEISRSTNRDSLFYRRLKILIIKRLNIRYNAIPRSLINTTKKWKIVENQIFSTILVMSLSGRIKYSFDIFNHLFFVSCSPQFRWRFSKMSFNIFAKEWKVLKA